MAAVQGCVARTVVCAQIRNQARLAQVQVANGRGEDEAALPLARLALADAEQGFGAASPDTVDTLTQLGGLARNTGRLDEARQAFDRAHAVAAQLRLRQAQRIVIRRSQALVLLDMGRAAESRSLFQALLQETRDGYERGQQWHLLGKAEWALGHLDAASHAAAQAEAEASRVGHSLGVLLARQAAARLVMRRGDAAAALTQLLAIRNALAADGQADASAYMRDVRRLIAQAQLRLGDLQAAEAGILALRQDEPPPPNIDTSSRIELGELAAALAIRQGRAEKAIQHLDEGLSLLKAQLPDQHPRRLRHELMLAHARWLAGEGDAQALRTAAQRFAAWLPASSDWHGSLAVLQNASASTGATAVAALGF